MRSTISSFSKAEMFDLTSGAVTARVLSHATTKVVTAIEEAGVPILVTRHRRVVGALVPTTAEEFIRGWAQRKPAVHRIPPGLKNIEVARAAAEVFSGLDSVDFSQAEEDTSDYYSGTVSIRELSKHTAAILRLVEDGETLLITRSNRVILAFAPVTSSSLLGSATGGDSLVELIKSGRAMRKAGETIGSDEFAAQIEDESN